jgi:hypothetical protein
MRWTVFGGGRLIGDRWICCNVMLQWAVLISLCKFIRRSVSGIMDYSCCICVCRQECSDERIHFTHQSQHGVGDDVRKRTTRHDNDGIGNVTNGHQLKQHVIIYNRKWRNVNACTLSVTARCWLSLLANVSYIATFRLLILKVTIVRTFYIIRCLAKVHWKRNKNSLPFADWQLLIVDYL